MWQDEVCVLYEIKLKQLEKYSGFQVHNPFFTSYNNLILFMTKLLGYWLQQ